MDAWVCGVMVGWMGEQVDGCMNKWMEGRKEASKHEQQMYGRQTDGWRLDGRMSGWMDGWMVDLGQEQVMEDDEWMDGWMLGGWMNGRKDELMDGWWIDGR